MQTSLPIVSKLTTLKYNWICWQHVLSQQPIFPLHIYCLNLPFHIILEAQLGRTASVAVHHTAALVSVLIHHAFNEQVGKFVTRIEAGTCAASSICDISFQSLHWLAAGSTLRFGPVVSLGAFSALVLQRSMTASFKQEPKINSPKLHLHLQLGRSTLAKEMQSYTSLNQKWPCLRLTTQQHVLKGALQAPASHPNSTQWTVQVAVCSHAASARKRRQAPCHENAQVQGATTSAWNAVPVWLARCDVLARK